MPIHLGITFLIFQKLSSVTGLRNHSCGSIFITGLSIICICGRSRRFGKMDRREKAYTTSKAHRVSFSVLTFLCCFKAYIKVLVII